MNFLELLAIAVIILGVGYFLAPPVLRWLTAKWDNR